MTYNNNRTLKIHLKGIISKYFTFFTLNCIKQKKGENISSQQARDLNAHCTHLWMLS